jgi:lantibiotic modifying enzyme
MSYSYSLKNNQEFDNKNVSDLVSAPINNLFDSSSSTNSLMSNSSSSSASESSQQQQLANRRVVKSCLWSTVIFAINFVSSILVINLAKW